MKEKELNEWRANVLMCEGGAYYLKKLHLISRVKIVNKHFKKVNQ